MNAGSDVHIRYYQDLRSMESKIRSSRLVPKIVALYQTLQQDQIQNPARSVEEILSDQRYAEKIAEIAAVDNEIADIKVQYSELKESSFAIARSLLYLGVVSLVAIPYSYFYGSGFGILDLAGAIVIVYSILALLIRLIPQMRWQDTTRRKFSDKYDKIMVGV